MFRLLRMFGYPGIAFGPDGTGAAPPAAAPPAAAPPAAASPAAVSAVPWGDANGTYTIADKPWTEVLPEGPTRELMTQKAYKNPQQLADAYHNLNKMVSGIPGGIENAVSLPPPDATPEQYDAFAKKLGRPENAEGYQLKFGEGVQVAPEMSSLAQKIAFDAGMPPVMAQKMADAYLKYTPELATQFAAAEKAEAERVNTQAVNALTESWKAQGGLEENVAAGKRVAATLGLDQAALGKIEAAMGGAAMLDLFARIGAKAGEGSFKGSAGGGGGATDVASMSKDQAQAEIARLQSDAKFQADYSNADPVVRGPAMQRLEQLYQRAG